jgi:hypothetical protein
MSKRLRFWRASTGSLGFVLLLTVACTADLGKLRGRIADAGATGGGGNAAGEEGDGALLDEMNPPFAPDDGAADMAPSITAFDGTTENGSAGADGSTSGGGGMYGAGGMAGGGASGMGGVLGPGGAPDSGSSGSGGADAAVSAGGAPGSGGATSYGGTTSPSPVKLSGTSFGTGPPQNGDTHNFQKAFDGDIRSYVDDSNATGGYTGIDLGVQATVSRIRFYPRVSADGSNEAARMVNGKFQCSTTSQTDGYVDLYTIAATPPVAWSEVAISNSPVCRYLRYLGAKWSWTNVAEIEFWGLPDH